MATGPNQILIKRSDTAGVQPSGLSFGEPAINTADGRLFFSQQTSGTPSGDFWEFRGFTNERFVTSVNGSTGDVTVTDLVGGATDIIGISNGVGFSGVTAVAFGSANDGVTFDLAVSGQTASVTLDLSGFEPSTVFRRNYTYNVLTGLLTDTRATSNGVLNYNQDTNIMSIYKFDKDGKDFREQLSSVDGSGVSGRVLLTFGAAAQSRAYEFDAGNSDTEYDNTELTLFINNISDGLTGGNGKTVSVEIELDNATAGARSMRLPGNGGTTFDTVVTSFNGLTGDVTTSGLHLEVAGISASGGTFSNAGGIFAQRFRDFDHGNDTGMELTTNHRIDFEVAGSEKMRLTTTLARVSGVNRFHLQDVPLHAEAGISLDNSGITFPDGTHQTSAASGGISELNGSTAAGITLAHGFRYKVSEVAASPSAPSAGEIAIKDFAGAGVVPNGFILHKNPHNSVIDLSLNSSDNDGHFTKFADAGGIVTVINEKTGKSAYFVNSDGSNFTSSSNVLEYTANANSYDATSALASAGDFVIVKLDFYTDAGVKSIGGTAFQNKGDLLLGKGLTAENAGGGQGRLRLESESIGFILDGNGSPLGTGDKLDALRQIPYDMQVDSTSAFVAAGVSGTDKTIEFAIKKTSALSGSISGTRLVLGNTGSADQTGFTFDGIGGGIHFRGMASASSVNGATVDQNEWIFPEIIGNSGDINKLQIFMKLTPQD